MPVWYPHPALLSTVVVMYLEGTELDSQQDVSEVESCLAASGSTNRHLSSSWTSKPCLEKPLRDLISKSLHVEQRLTQTCQLFC